MKCSCGTLSFDRITLLACARIDEAATEAMPGAFLAVLRGAQLSPRTLGFVLIAKALEDGEVKSNPTGGKASPVLVAAFVGAAHWIVQVHLSPPSTDRRSGALRETVADATDYAIAKATVAGKDKPLACEKHAQTDGEESYGRCS